MSMTPADRRKAMQSLPALAEADARLIDAYLDATWAEHGLARASLESYRRDLAGFARWRDQAPAARLLESPDP